MADVGTDVSRAAQPDHRIHVGAVHVDLTAVLVDDVADLDDRFLEHTVRRWISHHQRRQMQRVLFGFRAQVGDVDVAPLVRLHDDHSHSRHHRTRRICSVCRLRNEAHVAMSFVA